MRWPWHIALVAAVAGCVAAQDPRFMRLLESDAPQIAAAIPSRSAETLFIRIANEDVETWIGPFGEALMIQRGLIRGTRAMGEGLMAADITETHALLDAGKAGQARRFHSYLTGGDRTVVRSMICDVSSPRAGQVTVRGVPQSATVVTEDCANPSGDFVNIYWMQGGTIVQSRQWTGPVLGYLILRPLTATEGI